MAKPRTIASSRVALVLLAHGSRSPQVSKAMQSLIVRMESLQAGLTVKGAFLSLRKPGLEQALAELIAGGAQEIRVLPLFLMPGKHLKDIPALFKKQARRAGVNLSLLPPIGSSPDFPAFLLAASWV